MSKGGVAPEIAAILSSVPDGIYTVDRDGVITSFNPAAEAITGYSAEEAIGSRCCDLFGTGMCESHCVMNEAWQSGEAVVGREMEMVTREGRKIPVTVSTSVLRDARGQAIGGVKTVRDISQVFLLKKEIRDRYTFRDLVSRNRFMRQLFDVLPDVASTDATVLLHGETGTGKELVARSIHELSPRRDGPLVVVNCGALPEPLLEAEIFGARKGAYTGAVENRPGRLETANGGTLFLDEIGDLPLPLQVKLLRVLENREYQPLGARHPMKADTRFIAATHRNLEQMVEEGTFRQDLFFRINVVSLHIPPLRERREDIPLLLDSALERFNARYARKVRGFSSEALQVLLKHDYRGNVRELLNIVEQSVILCRSGEIEYEHLPPALITDTQAGEGKQDHQPQISWEKLSEALIRHRGNKTRVAQELGVDRTTLWRWMRKFESEGKKPLLES